MFFHINRIDNKPPKCFKKKTFFFYTIEFLVQTVHVTAETPP